MFPPTIRVLERGWLSSNNILCLETEGATLVDSGYLTHAAQTLALVQQALAGRPLTRLINTHVHSDHIGGNATLRREYGCRISVPAGSAHQLSAWDEDALLISSGHQQGEPFDFDDTLADGDQFMMGGLRWQALAAPGHEMHALVYYAPAEKILISGDALWEDGFGIMFPALMDDAAGLPSTRATLDKLAKLDVRAVIPGHGPAFADHAGALARAYQRLATFEASPERMARNALKALFIFSLLETRRMPRAEVGPHFGRVPVLREISTRFFHQGPAAVAERIVAELVAAGVLREEGGDLVPRGAHTQ